MELTGISSISEDDSASLGDANGGHGSSVGEAKGVPGAPTPASGGNGIMKGIWCSQLFFLYLQRISDWGFRRLVKSSTFAPLEAQLADTKS